MTFLHSYRDVSIVPILVGSLSPEREAHYGRILSKYLSDPSNFFVVSSDFCHWGQRFRYTYYDKSCGEIHQSIQRLDQQVSKLFVNDSKLRNFLLSFGSSFSWMLSIFICFILFFVLQGMSIIETLDTSGFTEYLKKYGNTICGRHPIGVLLNVKHTALK
jgi:MEMO1 family protein